MKAVQLLGLWGLWRRQVCKDMNCFRCRSYGPIRVFFSSLLQLGIRRPLWPFSVAPPIQALRGFPCLGSFAVVQHVRPPWLTSYSIDQCIRHLKGHPGWGSYAVVQCVRYLMGQPLYCSADWCWHMGRESLWWWLHPLHMTQQYHLASMAAWLSFTCVFYHDLLPQIPSTCLSSVNRSSCPGTSLQSLNSSS